MPLFSGITAQKVLAIAGKRGGGCFVMPQRSRGGSTPRVYPIPTPRRVLQPGSVGKQQPRKKKGRRLDEKSRGEVASCAPGGAPTRTPRAAVDVRTRLIPSPTTPTRALGVRAARAPTRCGWTGGRNYTQLCGRGGGAHVHYIFFSQQTAWVPQGGGD